MHVSELDEMLCSPSRLAIMLTLAASESLSFTDLKQDTGLADGNLHVQTQKLSGMKYLEIEKSGSGRRSRTTFRISDRGAYRLRDHLRRLQAVLDADRPGCRAKDHTRVSSDDSQVW